MNPFQGLARIVKDGYVNLVSGIGTWRDRSAGASWDIDALLTDDLLSVLYRDVSYAKRAVAIIPDECAREGYTLSGPTAKEIGVKSDALDLQGAFHDGHLWGRLFGGAVVFFVTDDPTPASEPRNLNAPGNVVALEVWDRRRVQIYAYYTDPRHPLFGRPRIYQISPISRANYTPMVYVHESRLVVFDGAKTDYETRMLNAGWDCSVLQDVWAEIAKFKEADGHTNVMLSEASQAVFKMKGLIEGLASKRSVELQTRLAFMDLARATTRAVVLDAGEEAGEDFHRDQINFAGIADVVRLKMQLVASAVGIPMSLLFSQGPGGLNATDENEMRAFYDRTASHQKRYLTPKLRRAFSIIAPGVVHPEITWAPLYKPTQKEQCEARWLQAQTDEKNILNGIYTEIEARRSHYGGPAYSYEIHVDPSAPAPHVAPPPTLAPNVTQTRSLPSAAPNPPSTGAPATGAAPALGGGT